MNHEHSGASAPYGSTGSFFGDRELCRVASGVIEVPSGLLADPTISSKAKGIYCFLLSRPKWERISVQGIAACMSDGTYAVNQAVKELCEAGYLRRERHNGEWSTRLLNERERIEAQR